MNTKFNANYISVDAKTLQELIDFTTFKGACVSCIDVFANTYGIVSSEFDATFQATKDHDTGEWFFTGVEQY